MRVKNIFSILSLLLIVSSFKCSNEMPSSRYGAIGAPGELLLVADNDVWMQGAGEALTAFLGSDFPGLPQPEPKFRITHIQYRNFKSHFKTYRNILMVRIDEKSSGGVSFEKNAWADGQYVARIVVNSVDQIHEVVAVENDRIQQFFWNGVINSLLKANELLKDKSIGVFLCDKYQCDMTFPPGYEVKTDSADFSWIAREQLDMIKGVVVYELPLKALDGGQVVDYIGIRNRLMKKYVPGSREGAHMTTEMNFPLCIDSVFLGGRKVVRIRGLWKLEGDFMGGPFLDYFIRDERRGRWLFLEGFVYAPSKSNKSLYMRELEAVLSSVRVNG